jgi:two-component system, NtrC family, sensor histidine kinase HydH
MLATRRPRTVLCVDDNAALGDNLREILADAGYRVQLASSCAEATARAREGFDLALVDVRLPDGDGVALATELRTIVRDAQVIMLTGFATVESAVAAVRAGAWAYLMKPCSTPALLVSVEQALRHLDHVEQNRELQRRARVAEKLAAIGTLTAGLSHEIKNPLNAAALQLTVLDRRIKNLPPEAQPTLHEPLRLVRDEIARLNRILEEFLQFARPRDLFRAPFELAPLLSKVLDLLAPQAEQAGIRVERRWEALGPLTGDDAKLKQVVMNLVLNAIQATPQGGTVRVEAARVGDEIRLTVDDSGHGIPEELRSRVFEPFFTTKAAGSGLGLPLCHAIVEQHGGSITVADSELGGARFVLHLPAEG